MGNNHNQYFGNQKRKIIILGLQAAGKTTLLQYISTEKFNPNTQKTKNLTIEDVKINNLQITFFDLAGGERQRVFWKQQYEGTQGIIFVIDLTFTKQEQQKSLEELQKLIKHFDSKIPFAICLSKIDQVEQIEWGKAKSDLVKDFAKKHEQRILLRVFELNYKNKETIKNLLSWLLSETKAI